MRFFTVFVIICFQTCVFAQSKFELAQKAQQELNEEFAGESSPLMPLYRANFTGLPFFEIDTTWVVEARLQLTPNEPIFQMPTTTSRMANYRKFGILVFEKEGQIYQLFVYQNTDLMKRQGYEDYLFLPFKDETNGEETYGGGRYMNLRIPDGETIILDFNTCYNPYCAYNERYSCPIVPNENLLNAEVRAGVKNHH